MRIMEIVSGRGANGAITHCMLLARELARRGNEVTVVCYPDSWVGQQLATDPVDIVRSDLHRWPLDELRRVAAICRERGIEVVHTHMSRAHFFGILLRRLSRVPCVATAHNQYLQPHWVFNDQVIACSEATRRYHRRFNLVRKSRIQTIHNFIDEARFRDVDPAARARIRAEFKVADDQLLVGQIGTICPRKGQLHLVRALPTVLERFPETRLLLVGDRDARLYARYVQRVEREITRLGIGPQVIWGGFRRDVPEVLTALDVFVLASLVEMHPLSVLEAMAQAVPVVATAVGGIPETVTDGETGFLVPPANPAALAEALLSLLGDPRLRRQIACRGPELVNERFSPASQVPRIEAVLAAAARRGKGA